MTEQRVTFTFDGREIEAREGEPVAVALWRAGMLTQTRSIKYHRPRGPMCLTGDCPGCMVRVDGVPNVRGCQTGAADGLTVESQVGMPSADRDVLSVVDRVFKHFDHERAFVRPRIVRETYQAIARRLAGFGDPPTGSIETSPGERIETDVLVVGGGPAGLAAAHAAREQGASVLLAERDALGGSLLHTPREIRVPVEIEQVSRGPVPGPTLAGQLSEAIGGDPSQGLGDGAGGGVSLIEGAVIGIYPEGILAADASGGSLRVHQVHADRTVLATGAYEGPVVVPGNDTPGVIGARAARMLLNRWDLPPGEQIIVAEPREQGHRFLEEARASGIEPAIVQDLDRIEGGKRVERVIAEGRTLPADAVVVDPGLTPAPELGRQAGIPYTYEAVLGGRVPLHTPEGGTPVPNVLVAGSCAGLHNPEAALVQGHAAGTMAAGAEAELDPKVLLSASVSDETGAAIERVWRQA